MDIEQKQADLIDHFVKQAAQKGSALGSVILEATSHPSLFAFSEILAVPCVAELEGTENSVYLDVLRLFAHGTWSDYKGNSGRLPQLVPDQVLKLKQLTVLTLAETNKVLPYDQLMLELDVTNVRELEDFLINECMYAGIVRGKLDQLRRCFEVQFAAGRDLRPGQLGSMIQTLSNWLDTSDNLLISIQEKIKWADTMSELDKKHRKEVEDRVEEVKKSITLKADVDFRGLEEIYSEPGGVMDYEEDRSRPKRRRHPIS
ncbi:COP9 signalosome complex subunit 7 isoform X1 [Herrania umbratica]|uniref:COP9 signalosome complex subunit 7 isoform X1 n=1 Tax=Herrania umbratica TaxID=108875 RepID=A0A6J1A207_9ROSI|nr:COP9 signalosome complex subunit 7 isoform X1 [Herrania umbratica]